MLCGDSISSKRSAQFSCVKEGVEEVRHLLNRPERWHFEGAARLFAGVDLGTSMLKVIVIDDRGFPRAAVMREADVTKSGLVVDYFGALQLLKEIIGDIRSNCPTDIEQGATSFPPKTESANVETTRYILEGAGLEVIRVLDEPTAANNVLNLDNGAIVDVGGGTTGISVIKAGKVVYTNDEPTGGIHLSLVLAGHLGISYEEAEKLKKDRGKAKQIFPIIKPVLEKIAAIIRSFLEGFDGIEEIYMVGGTCEIEEVSKVISEELNIRAIRPYFPQAITPYGIALSCLSPVRLQAM